MSNLDQLSLIGNSAFLRNSNVRKVNLSGCTALETIDNSAFYLTTDYNGNCEVDLTNCNSLKVIGSEAFHYTNYTDIDLSSCISLETIGFGAFSETKLTSIDLTNCTKLAYIGQWAFKDSDISGFTLPTLTYDGFIGWVDNVGTSYNGGEDVYNKHSYYIANFPCYTLKNEDVTIENGVIQSISYDGISNCIIIPDILNNQNVIGLRDGSEINGLFSKLRITSIQLPSTIERIGDYAFCGQAINKLDLSSCHSLKYIGRYSFAGLFQAIVLNLLV